MGDHERYKYTTAEKILISLALLLSGAMLYIYVFDVSLKKLVFPSDHDLLFSRPIGKVVSLSGEGLRQRAGEFEFGVLTQSTQLFLNDTLMTGRESTMVIELKDGQRFELEPDSLIKLSFGADFLATGIVQLSVLHGAPTKKIASTSTPQATGTSASSRTSVPAPIVASPPAPPPTPPPPPEIPLALSQAIPSPHAQFTLTPEEFSKGKKRIEFSFKLNKNNADINLRLFRPESQGKPRKELYSTNLSTTTASVSSRLNFGEPGPYEWEARDAKGALLIAGDFRISPYVSVLQTLPILNNSNKLEGFSAKKEFDGFKLHWRPIKGRDDYVVRIFDGRTGKLFLEKKMRTTELILNKNNLIFTELEYSVERTTSKGFIATSDRQKFTFQLLPPALTIPIEDALIDKKALDEADGLVFFTWMKTNYTERYRFELSKTKDFSPLIHGKTLNENYVSVKLRDPGRYYWRVKSLSSGIWSDFGETRAINMLRRTD